MTPWVATGKHLCGAATDFTLQCCASSLHRKANHQQLRPSHTDPHNQCANSSSAQDLPMSLAEVGHHQGSPGNSSSNLEQQGMPHGPQKDAPLPKAADVAAASQVVEAPCIDCNTLKATEGLHRSSQCSGNSQAEPVTQNATSQPSEASSGSQQGVGVQGLAIATCCHHRCSWQHYVGKPLIRSLGFSPDEFEVISWMTGTLLYGCMTPLALKYAACIMIGGALHLCSKWLYVG